jgi:hypothetical protein
LAARVSSDFAARTEGVDDVEFTEAVLRLLDSRFRGRPRPRVRGGLLQRRPARDQAGPRDPVAPRRPRPDRGHSAHAAELPGTRGRRDPAAHGAVPRYEGPDRALRRRDGEPLGLPPAGTRPLRTADLRVLARDGTASPPRRAPRPSRGPARRASSAPTTARRGVRRSPCSRSAAAATSSRAVGFTKSSVAALTGWSPRTRSPNSLVSPDRNHPHSASHC